MTEESDATEARSARIATPPPPSERVRLEARQIAESSSSRRPRQVARHSDGLHNDNADSDTFESSLFRELHRPQRESTPSASPHRKRQRINGDRYVF